MDIKWFNESPKSATATLTPAHITFNKTATHYFEKAFQVMMGYDASGFIIVIKPLSKAAALRGNISETSKYNITVKSSYSRVTNKAFMQTTQDVFNLELPETGRKYEAFWDDKNEFLTVNLKEEL